MKKIKLTMLFLIGFSALLLITAVIINLPAFDEDLLPEVVAIKNIQARPFGENDALPAIIAFNGLNFQESIKQVRELLNQKIQKSGVDYLTDQEYQILIGKNQFDQWPDAYLTCNSRIEMNCMAALFRQVKTQPVVDASYREQLNRYNELIKYAEFHDQTQLDNDAPLLPFRPIRTAKKVFIADSFVTLDSSEFLNTVIRDAQFWRMMLTNSNLLITKMVAVSSYRESLNGSSAAIKQAFFSPAELNDLAKSINPLNDNESNMSNVFVYEFKYGMNWYDDADRANEAGLNDWLGFYQPNATLNWWYSNTIKPLINISNLSSRDFYHYLNSEQPNEDFRELSWGPSAMYNPTGKNLVGFSMPAYTDYIGRTHDLNGMISLLQLQIELALNPELPVLEVIKQSKWVNPYTLEPMSYDAGAKRIYFECMDKTSSCELYL